MTLTHRAQSGAVGPNARSDGRTRPVRPGFSKLVACGVHTSRAATAGSGLDENWAAAWRTPSGHEGYACMVRARPAGNMRARNASVSRAIVNVARLVTSPAAKMSRALVRIFSSVWTWPSSSTRTPARSRLRPLVTGRCPRRRAPVRRGPWGPSSRRAETAPAIRVRDGVVASGGAPNHSAFSPARLELHGIALSALGRGATVPTLVQPSSPP